ncbi:MAG: NUDIX domain-containing protein [Candidatus Paceibacterota bacterium]
MDYKLFVASKGFIKNTKGEILILKESSSYEDGTNFAKYDVPGGRIKPGEKLEESLKREVYEETGLEIQVLQSFCVGEWRPKVKDENWQVIGVYFVCETLNENIVLSKDHDEYIWIRPEDYKNYNIIDNLANAFEVYLKL